MSDVVIKAENLSKVYKLYDDHMDRLKESLHPLRKKYHKDFYALKDVDLEIKKGETVGIIGKNGAGKSTLLKILTGVLTPSEGTYDVKGKVSSLLELGVGFNPELSGMENIYFYGTVFGYSKVEIESKLKDIIDFADIGEFIHQPVKTYSSGMVVRLAFSVAISVSPEILIVDEALSVGDMFFQAKCMTRIKEMIEDENITLIFVSHDIGAVKSVCEKTILMDEGGIVEFGESSDVVEKYFSMRIRSSQEVLGGNDLGRIEHKSIVGDGEFQKRAAFQRVQNGKARFLNVQLLNEKGEEVQSVEYGEIVTLRMFVEAMEDIGVLTYGYHVRDKNGADIVYSDSVIEKCSLENVKCGDRFVLDWKFKAAFSHGGYNVACVLSIPIDLEISKVDFCDFIPIATVFAVEKREGGYLYGSVHVDNIVDVVKL